MHFRKFWLVFVALTSFHVTAQESVIDELTFGSEFSFSRDDFIAPGSTSTDYPLRQGYQNRFKKLVINLEDGREYEVDSAGNIVLRYSNFEITVATDIGTFEAKLSPGTLAQMEERAPLVQRDLFDNMAMIEVNPQEFRGGGHIHIGVGAFGNDLTLFRNFVVDYYNHNGLAEGGLNFDENNSRSLALAPDGDKNAVREVIREIDNGTITDLRQAMTKLNKARGSGKAMRFNTTLMTIEIRAIRPQRSMNDFVKQIRLFSKRFEFLEKQSSLVPFGDWNPTRTSLEALDHTHRYVTESGLDWKDYRHMVLPAWQNEGADLDTFEARIRERTCATEMIDIFFKKVNF